MTRNARTIGCLVAVVSVGVLFSPAIAGENTWTTVGPTGATVTDIAIRPANNQIIYIGTVQNGIYKTTDGGETWSHVNANRMFSCMRRIAFHPFAPETVYATATNGIFKSSNSGETWMNITPHYDNEFQSLLVHPTDPSLIMAGGVFDSWTSKNGGTTWDTLHVPIWENWMLGPQDLVVDLQHPDVLYFVWGDLGDGVGVWKSEDRGQSWFNIQNNLPRTTADVDDIEVDPVDPSNLYLSIDAYDSTGNCLAKSTNGGQTWFYINPPQMTAPKVRSVSVMPWQHKTIFACTLNEGVLVSDDGGMTWRTANQGVRTPCSNCIEFDTISHIIYLGTLSDGIYKSSDGGQSWLKISDAMYVPGCYSLAFLSSPNLKVYTTARQGVFVWDANEPEEWQYVPIAGFRTSVYSVCSDPCAPGYLYGVSLPFWYGYDAAVEPVGFYRSIDFGESWRFFLVGQPPIFFDDIAVSCEHPETRTIFLASWPAVFRSIDTGETWEVCSNGLTTPVSYTAIAAAPSDPDVVAAGDDFGIVYLSTDRGFSWQPTSRLPYDPWASIEDLEFDPLDADCLWASVTLLGLFKTTDAGASWVNTTADLPWYISITGIAINPLNPINVFVTSNSYGVYQTHDGGQHWESFNAGIDTANVIGQISFVPGDTTQLFVASARGSVWSITRTPTGIEGETPVLPHSLTAANYPNPFNTATNITFTLPQAGPVTLTVYDALGRKLLVAMNDVLSAGSHKVDVAMPQAPSGVYFYRLKTEKEDVTGKMLLLK